MKTVLLAFMATVAVASCETPSQIKSSPDNATNTSGTTGSATMTNEKPATESGTLPASGKDSLGNLRDSLGVVKDTIAR